ncbi:hypothetical protein Cni_G28519 [Canna indica]|uniref:RNase H type-1 domain-containing protein n=1 Tax=Canna indica TaxID=4628 RepID=A0AAQ3L5P0_9LILI|nr:hypothetical protein Cni_G28519 [Canna indica]
MLIGKQEVPWELECLIKNIQALGRKLNVKRWIYINRKRNEVVHDAARMELYKKGFRIWSNGEKKMNKTKYVITSCNDAFLEYLFSVSEEYMNLNKVGMVKVCNEVSDDVTRISGEDVADFNNIDNQGEYGSTGLHDEGSKAGPLHHYVMICTNLIV